MIYDINGNPIGMGGSTDKGLPYLPAFGETTLIKHRGGNSASDMATAFSNGYKSVEGDVRFTSDAVPIMCHDTTTGGLTISSNTLADLQEATTIYTLDDWLMDCKKYNILAEIDFTKTYTQAQCEILVGKIKDHAMTNRCTVECYIDSSAMRLAAYADDLILSVLGCRTNAIIDSLVDIADACRKIICVIPHDVASASLVAYAHKKGYLSRIWTNSTTDTVSVVENYLDMGVDFVLTDNVKPSDITPVT